MSTDTTINIACAAVFAYLLGTWLLVLSAIL